MLRTMIRITDLCLDETHFPITKTELITCVDKHFKYVIHELENIPDRMYSCRDEIDEELEGPTGG